MPTISVVTISFNQAAYLERCIESVLSQRNVDVEYIVVDPGSTDGSREIISRYRSKLACVVFEKDDGPADGLNRGLAKCTGDIFYYLNADDVVLPDVFSEAVEVFRRTGADVVYGNGWVIDANGVRIRRVFSAPRITPALQARGVGVIVQQAAFIRTSKLKEVGGFNPHNTTCWDGEAFLDLSLSGARFLRVWRDWGEFRVYPESISGSGRLNAQYEKDQQRLQAKTFGPKHRPSRVMGRLAWFLTRVADIRRLAATLSGR